MVSTIHEVNQWGRKDPFTPSSATRNVEVQIYNANGTAITKGTNGISGTPNEEFKLEDKVKTTINNLIQNPSTHYNLGDGTNWTPIASTEGYNNTTKEGDWWNPTIKTIYDPCPNGYRIPKYGTYGTSTDWTISTWTGNVLTAGQIWNSNIDTFFPASGLRDYTSGLFYAVGSAGYSWLSTPYKATYGYLLQFYPDAVYPNNYHSRSYGWHLRCIKE